jgi:hypothetical protein
LWANIARPGGQPTAMHCDQGGAMPRYFDRQATIENGGKTLKGYRGSDAYDHSAQKQWDDARNEDGTFNTDNLMAAINKMQLPEYILPPVYCQIVYFLTVGLICSLALTQTAVEHVLTFHSLIQSSLISSSFLSSFDIPKPTRLSLDLRSPSAGCNT